MGITPKYKRVVIAFLGKEAAPEEDEGWMEYSPAASSIFTEGNLTAWWEGTTLQMTRHPKGPMTQVQGSLSNNIGVKGVLEYG